MNRGIARRELFHEPREVRAFLALVAREVRSGRLEIHAFCVMTTHFHLLVCSPIGELSEAMRQIENRFVRWFNRRRRRDGPLFRGRFRSKLVESLEYRRILVRYIDENPVTAGVVTHPASYPFGSAATWYAGGTRPWLSTAWIATELRADLQRGLSSADAYSRAFGRPLTVEQRQWVEFRRYSRYCGDELPIFFSGSSVTVQNWMLRKARLADGTRPGGPVAGADSVRAVISSLSDRLAAVRVGDRPSQLRAVDLLETMLLRDLCGLSWERVGLATGVALATAHRRYQLHRIELARGGEYASAAVDTAQAVVRRFVTQ